MECSRSKVDLWIKGGEKGHYFIERYFYDMAYTQIVIKSIPLGV